MRNLTIIGAGPGDPRLLTEEAREAVCKAERVYAAPRIGEGLRELNPRIRQMKPSEIREALRSERDTDAAVLVSGDAGFYSLSGSLMAEFADAYRIEIINGLNSLQILCSRLGISYDDVKTVSLHGRERSILGPVSYHRRVFALTGGKNGVRELLGNLAGHGPQGLKITVAENLSYPDERILTGSPEELAEIPFGELAVLLAENPDPAPLHTRLRDEDFLRADVPMTKESVRTLSVARLEVAPSDTVWDIGAGTGSVSVALARAACEGMVWALERNPQAVELVRENRRKLGACNLIIAHGEAPGALKGLPTPDKVFIGGSGGMMEKILSCALERNPAVGVCINTVALESLREAVDCLSRLGFGEPEIECVNIAAAKKTGGYHMMLAQNPVYVISARGIQK